MDDFKIKLIKKLSTQLWLELVNQLLINQPLIGNKYLRFVGIFSSSDFEVTEVKKLKVPRQDVRAGGAAGRVRLESRLTPGRRFSPAAAEVTLRGPPAGGERSPGCSPGQKELLSDLHHKLITSDCPGAGLLFQATSLQFDSWQR